MMNSVKSLCDEITSQKNNLNRLNDLLKLALVSIFEWINKNINLD